MPIKFLLLGGGLGFLGRGGWKCQFYLYGHGDFPYMFIGRESARVAMCKFSVP